MTKKFKIIKRKKDCVLLYKPFGNRAKYMVKDIEGDIIYMCLDDLKGAEKAFEEYDLEDVRRIRREDFDKWLNENAEA